MKICICTKIRNVSTSGIPSRRFRDHKGSRSVEVIEKLGQDDDFLRLLRSNVLQEPVWYIFHFANRFF
ncbi:MAG: hypothetical protein DWH94_03980 [Planctomycetota bacterium]|nr:MAG: hypothetical protein DWH80_06970 [Planctomycetota bacterium]RLS59647.1 MAG: hypothetical protein DWH94_03980 [Planctomycetota bacterium]TSA07005.1 MAG: hypothetical protein D4R77_05225 [Planctomycetaceae bacterium]